MGEHVKKTKAQLIAELERLENRLAVLESASSSQEAAKPSRYASDEFCRCMVDGSPIPAFVISTDHTIVFWNQALAELSGLPAAAMIGTREQWRAFYSEERPCMADLLIEGVPDEIQEWYAGKCSKSDLVAGAYEATDFFPALGNNGRWLRFTAAILRDVSGTVLGAIETLEDVTEHKRAEEALRESEEKYRELIETTDTGYVIIDQRGNVLDANPKYISLAGYESLEEIRNHNVLEWTADHIKPKNLEAIKQCMARGFIRNLEIEYVHRDGTRVPIEVNATVVKTYTGTTILSLCRDITERKRAEEALQESGQRFREMIEHGNDTIVILDSEGIFRYGSPSVERIVGYNPSELEGRSAFDFLHPDDLPGTLAAFLEVLQEPGAVRRVEYRFYHKDGSWRVLEGIGCNLLDRPGINGVVVNSRDITERKETEESLRRSEKRFQQVAENAQEWIWEVDADGLYTYVSPTVERILGYRPEEIVGKMHFYDMFHPENREEMTSAALHVFAEKQSFREFPNRNVHRAGKDVWLLTSGIPMLDEAGNLAGYRGVDADITERKRAEEQLRHVVDLQSAILNNAAYMLISTDNEGVITTFNPAAERALGYTSEECIGTLTPIVLHDSDEVAERARTFSAELGVTIDPGFEVFAAKARRKLPNEYEWTYIRKDGLRFPVLLSVTALCDPQGNITGFLGMANDITERKQAEEMILHSERRTAIMNEIAQVFLTVPDTEMYGEILSILIRATNSPYGIFGFIEENGDLVIPSLTKGIWQECQVSGKSFELPILNRCLCAL